MSTPPPPVVDGRTREQILAETRTLAPYYIDEWDPDADDTGTALLELFATMTTDIVERLNQAPEKHRRSFFEELGFDRVPPQPARLPLTFQVADGVAHNVAVSSGTQALAPAAEERPETLFEVIPNGDFEATPANIAAVYSVRPETDHVGEHWATLATGSASELFDGPNSQEHALYLGHNDLLVVDPGTTIRVNLRTDAPVGVLRDHLVWEYYGEESVGDETVEVWHPVDDLTVWRRDEVVEVSFTFRGEPAAAALVEVVETAAVAAETDFAATGPPATTVETKWLRCRSLRAGHEPDVAPTALFDVDLQGVTLVAGTRDETFAPDEVLANDVPQRIDPDDDDILPFGTVPRRGDACYVASTQAFTKPETTIVVDFTGPTTTGDPEGVTPDPTLSWEYWDGNNWARLALESDTTKRLTTAGTVIFDVPSDLAATTVAGQEGHWIRVRLVGGEYVRPTATPKGANGTESGTNSDTPTDHDTVVWETTYEGAPPRFGHIELRFSVAPPDEEPEHAVSFNNLAFEADVTRPFVGPPNAEQTLYVGFDKPLSDGPIQVLYSVADREFPANFYPRVRWEYATDPVGDEWASLDTTDETERLTRRGIVGLVFPEVTTPHTRFGRDLHWVRARVNGDQFGAATTTVSESPVAITHIDAVDEYIELTNIGTETIDLSGYLVDFEYAQPETQVRSLPEGSTLAPGASLGIATGVASPLAGHAPVTFDFAGPVINDYTPDTVAVLNPEGRPVAIRTNSLDETEAEAPQVRPDVSGDTGIRADEVSDGSDAKGGDENGHGSNSIEPCEGEVVKERRPIDAEPCEETLVTTPPAGQPTDAPPSLMGLYLNTAWAENVHTIKDESLGSSNGEQWQSFTVATPPMTDETVWIDESAVLSAGTREALVADPETAVEVVTTASGDPTAVWVRWTRVSNFLGSGLEDRHYMLDPTTGTITFGDGNRGAIPSQGTDNIRTTYRTGGGTAGNVPATAIESLVSSLPFVEAVTNPESADGGADAETTEAVLDRAPKELRDRGRAVTPADYERVALSASRKVARTRCLPTMDVTGGTVPGWVTLLIVPRSGQTKPVPSAELKRQVRAVLDDRAPATLVSPPMLGVETVAESMQEDAPPPELVVRGPSYVGVAVDARLVASAGTTVSTLEERTTEQVSAFLHPLSGGGTGWEFGVLPCRSDIYALLESIDGVDHVASLELTFTGSESSVTVSEDDRPPRVARDILVYSGTHRINATGGV